jgi:nitrous oxidase accessory protein NosD
VRDNVIACVNAGGTWVHAQGEAIVHVTIDDNVIVGDDTALLAGIGLTTVTDALIAGNEIRDFARAVLVATNSEADVINNHFMSCAAGVHVDGTSTVYQSDNVIQQERSCHAAPGIIASKCCFEIQKPGLQFWSPDWM